MKNSFTKLIAGALFAISLTGCFGGLNKEALQVSVAKTLEDQIIEDVGDAYSETNPVSPAEFFLVNEGANKYVGIFHKKYLVHKPSGEYAYHHDKLYVTVIYDGNAQGAYVYNFRQLNFGQD